MKLSHAIKNPIEFSKSFSRSLAIGKGWIIGIPYTWLFLLTIIPLLIILKISFSSMGDAGVNSLMHWSDNVLNIQLNFANYKFIFDDPLYLHTYLSSLGYGLITAFICLLIGYPFAYFMARANPNIRPTLVMLVMLPFWTSFLLRIYAWKTLLDANGLINQVLMSLHLVSEPVQLMNTSFSFMLGMVYAYLPFMILPLYATLVKLDGRLLEAAADLGATPLQAFWLVTVPLSKQGIIAGSMLVFIPAVGEYVIPELLAGPSTVTIGRVLWDEFFNNNDWSMACAVAIVMILIILIPTAIFNKAQSAIEETK